VVTTLNKQKMTITAIFQRKKKKKKKAVLLLKARIVDLLFLIAQSINDRLLNQWIWHTMLLLFHERNECASMMQCESHKKRTPT